ncbi:galanin receptor type 1 [Antennarius striatus]|uniref:galanin receptor type 1 n=1 Tax=Antennarius striatus TaxID=241820 RepID=UPI0035AE7D34
MDVEELIESIIRAFMFLSGILGNNWLAIRSLPARKSGFRTNEVLFLNLAVSNLITNYLVDLPDTMADFAGRWFLGEIYCGIFRFCADLSETSSIYTTFFISVFWHQKLVGSLKRGGALVRMDSLILVGCLLAGSWTVAVVFSIPHFFFVTLVTGNDSHEDCIDVFPNALARQTYEVFYLTLANAVPLAGIVFASVQIVITLLENQRRIKSINSEASKEKSKDAMKVSENRNNAISASAGPSKDLTDSAAPNQIYAGLANEASANTGLSEYSNNNPPPKKEEDRKVGAPLTTSKPTQPPVKPSASSVSQVRAAKSVVAVASVFLVCWLTHLFLRITNNIQTSSLVVEIASYIAASYTCIIPYIFLHGVKKLNWSCKR